MTYRNKKLLKAARDCPHCMDCGRPNQDNVVAAHSNQLRDGKGTGHKASDYRIAFIDMECHREIDTFYNMTAEEAIARWEEAHRKTIGYLFEQGIIGVL